MKTWEELFSDLSEMGIEGEDASKLAERYVRQQAEKRSSDLKSSKIFDPKFGGQPTDAELMANVSEAEWNQAQKSARALQDYERTNTPQEIYKTSSTYRIPREEMRRAVTKKSVLEGSPVKLSSFIDESQMSPYEQLRTRISDPTRLDELLEAARVRPGSNAVIRKMSTPEATRLLHMQKGVITPEMKAEIEKNKEEANRQEQKSRREALEKEELEARKKIKQNEVIEGQQTKGRGVSPEEVKTRFKADRNRFEMQEGPTAKSEGLSKEEAIAAFKKKRAENIKAIENQKLYSDIDIVQKSWERLSKKLNRNPTEAEIFAEIIDNLGDKASDFIEKPLGKLGKIVTSKPAQFLERGVLAPVGVYAGTKGALESAQKGEYADATSDALAAGSGLATMAGSSTLALPLGAGSLAVAGSKSLSKQIPELSDKGISYDPTEGYSRSEEELAPEIENVRSGTKELFDLSPIFGKNKWQPQFPDRSDKDFKPRDYKKNAITEDELEALSDPTKVAEEKRQKIFNDALARSRSSRPGVSETEHQQFAIDALRTYEGNQKFNEFIRNIPEKISSLFTKSEEDIQKERQAKLKQYEDINEQRKKLGLPLVEIPKELIAPQKYVTKPEDYEPYQFKKEQLTATPKKASGLAEGKESFDDFLSRAQVEYPEVPGQDYVKELSDEELQETAKAVKQKQEMAPSVERPKGVPSPEEVKRYIVEEAKKRGEDPALALAQFGQESSFNPLAVSKTGAKGLGQMFSAAFTNAKEIDTNKSLKNLTYEDLIKPENWKQQIDAAFDYLKWIDKAYKPKDQQTRLRHYIGGSGPKSEYWDKPETVDYAPSIFQRAKQYEKELADIGPSRSPASDLTPEEADETKNKLKEEAKRRIQKFLETKDASVLQPGDAPLIMGPYANPFAYEQGMKSSERLLSLKKQLDALRGGKEKVPAGAESATFTPVEGPDGLSFEEQRAGATGADGTAQPQAGAAPTTEPSAESSAKTEIDNQIEMARLRGQDTDYQRRLKQAEEDAADQALLGRLGKASERILAGALGMRGRFALKPTEDTIFDEMIKTKGEPLAKLKRQMDLSKDDPDSDISKSMRGLIMEDLKKIGMSPNLSGLSFNQMEQIYPHLSRTAERIETTKLREEYKKETKRGEKLGELDKFVTNRIDNLQKDKKYQAYEKIKDSEAFINNAIKNPNSVADITALYDFIKVLDTESAVREGETALAKKADGMWGQLELTLRNLTRNPRMLTDKTLKDIRTYVELVKKRSQENIYGKLASIEKQINERIKNQGIEGVDAKDKMSVVFPNYDQFYQETYVDPELKKKADKFFKGDVDAARKFYQKKGEL